MNKIEIRQKYRLLREALSLDEIESLSLEIVNKLLELPIWNRIYYHIFLTIESKKEVHTEYLLHVLQGKDKSIVIPKTNFSKGILNHYLLQENTILVKSNYGIPEPVSGIEIPPDQIEVVFVPLLAFDIKGNRIGYGKGFYDRFLAKCNPDAIFVGLSFFDAENELEHKITDIPLDFCVTPRKIYSF